jgi:hypothetical protein
MKQGSDCTIKEYQEHFGKNKISGQKPYGWREQPAFRALTGINTGFILHARRNIVNINKLTQNLNLLKCRVHVSLRNYVVLASVYFKIFIRMV